MERTQSSYNPSLHQRRLWQRERRFEEQARELNWMFAECYSDQRQAAVRVYSWIQPHMAHNWRITLRLKLLAPVVRAWNRLRLWLATATRSKWVETIIKTAIFYAIGFSSDFWQH